MIKYFDGKMKFGIANKLLTDRISLMPIVRRTHTLFIAHAGTLENHIQVKGMMPLETFEGARECERVGGENPVTSGIMFITRRFDGIRNLFLYRP